MFGWAVTFLLIAIIAGVFGFAGIAGTPTAVAKVLFFLGLAAFLGLLAAGRRTRAAPPRGPGPQPGLHSSRGHPT
jgi:uncharacterized membrane protein YtjA (UPF0391 family)